MLSCYHGVQGKDAFYLTPTRPFQVFWWWWVLNETTDYIHFAVWYGNCPVDHKMLGETVKRLCKDAGIEGRFTCHSLRATTSQGLQRGIPDKFEMGRIPGIEMLGLGKNINHQTLQVRLRFQRSSNVIFFLHLWWRLSLNWSSGGRNYVFRNNRVELQLIAMRTFMRVNFRYFFFFFYRFWV